MQGLTNQVNLSEVAVFLQLSLSRMGDKRGVSSDEIEVDADKDLVKVRKIIFKSAAFDSIKSLDSEIRRYVRSQCFPYDAGLHLCSLKMVPMISTKLKFYFDRRVLLIEDFAEAFPYLHEQIRDHLRALHRDSDYDLNDIPSKFTMGWQFLMLTTPMSLESINTETLRNEQRKMQERWNEALENARMLLRETCLNLVSHLRESLSNDTYGAPKRLSTSTVTSLREFFQTFDMRNITNDTQLEELAKQGKDLLRGVDVESLRTEGWLRARIRTELSGIEQAINDNLSTQPTRRIRVKE